MSDETPQLVLIPMESETPLLAPGEEPPNEIDPVDTGEHKPGEIHQDGPDEPPEWV